MRAVRNPNRLLQLAKSFVRRGKLTPRSNASEKQAPADYSINSYRAFRLRAYARPRSQTARPMFRYSTTIALLLDRYIEMQIPYYDQPTLRVERHLSCQDLQLFCIGACGLLLAGYPIYNLCGWLLTGELWSFSRLGPNSSVSFAREPVPLIMMIIKYLVYIFLGAFCVLRALSSEEL